MIREKNTLRDDLQQRISRLEQADAVLQQTEEGNDAVQTCAERVGELLSGLGIGGFSDWGGVLKTKRHKLSATEAEWHTVHEEYTRIEAHAGALAQNRDDLSKRHGLLREDNRQKALQCDSRLRTLDERLAAAGSRLSDMRRERQNVLRSIEELKGQLSGIIRCPSCRHEFLLADENFDIAAGRDSLQRQQERLQRLTRTSAA